MTHRTLAMAALAAALSIASATSAHDGANGAVKKRMDAMESVGAALKRLNLRTRSQQVSPQQAREAVALIRNVALNTPRLFEEQDLSAPTEAKPEIWSDWDEFVDLSQNLAAYTERLDAAIGNPEALAGEIRRMGEICSACHRRYRE